MAFDGFVISNIVNELNEKILNGRIYKIYQPEADEITLVIKQNRENQGSIFLPVRACRSSIFRTRANRTRYRPPTFVCCFGSIWAAGVSSP